MTDVVKAPRELIESLADLRFSPKTDARLKTLMDRNNEGELSADEHAELEALAELSETIGILRAEALRTLGRSPT